MAEPDWRALLAAVIEDGYPMEETDYGMTLECRYCGATDVAGPAQHATECAWLRAVAFLESHPRPAATREDR